MVAGYFPEPQTTSLHRHTDTRQQINLNMYVSTHLLLVALLALTVVPGLRTIAKAESLKRPPPPLQAPEIALSLPRCARRVQTKIIKEISCRQNDSQCICSKKKNFIPRLQTAVARLCKANDRKAVKDFSEAYCGLNLPLERERTAAVSMPATTHMTLPLAPTVTYECSVLSVGEYHTGNKSSNSTSKPHDSGSHQSGASHKGMISAAARPGRGIQSVAMFGMGVILVWVFVAL